jgi:hypothetical protein
VPARFSSSGRKLPGRNMRPRPRSRATGIAGTRSVLHRREIGRCGLRGGDRPRPALDRHEGRAARQDDRPAGGSFHAMRGISAHSNGFQTCRAAPAADPAGIDRLPRRFPLQAALPQAGCRPSQGRMAVPAQTRPLAGPHLGYPRGPGRPAARSRRRDASASTRRFPGMRRCRRTADAHGDLQRACGDPYGIDVLFLYMANMAWNSSMNTCSVMEMLTDKDAEWRVRDPEDHLFRCLFLGNGGLCRSDPARHDLSGTARLHLAARPADQRARGAVRFDPLAGGRAGPRRARLPDVLLDLGARLGLPGIVDEDGSRSTPITPTTSSTTSASRASARCRAGAARTATRPAAAKPNPTSSKRYIENGGFSQVHVPEEAALFQARQPGLERLGDRTRAFQDGPVENIFQLYLEPLRKFQLAPKARSSRSPPPSITARGSNLFRPAANWYPPFRGRGR